MFDGDTYSEEHDGNRLYSQFLKVRSLMWDQQWRTLEEIRSQCGGTLPALSARLRDLRKPKFGSFIVDRRARGSRERGLFEYKLVRETSKGTRILFPECEIHEAR